MNQEKIQVECAGIGEVENRKEEERKIDLHLDISKLIFGSVVLSRILQRELNVVDDNILHDIMLIGGIVAAIITFILGLVMGKRVIKAEKTSFRRKKRGRR